MKRVISFDETFMSIAYITNKRGKNPQFGVCVVNKENHIIKTAYSGAVKGLGDENLNNTTAYVVVFSLKETENIKLLVKAGVKEIVCFEDENVAEEIKAAVKKIASESKVKLRIYNEDLNYIYVAKRSGSKPISEREYFMSVAYLISKRSKDPSTQVGVCIVDKNKKIISTGYNATPNGWEDKDFPWNKKDGPWVETKFPYVIHGEINAILSSIGYGDLKGATLYTTIFPWNEHAKIISQSGIKELIYLSDEDSQKEFNILAKQASKIIFDKVGVKYNRIDEPLNWLL